MSGGPGAQRRAGGAADDADGAGGSEPATPKGRRTRAQLVEAAATVFAERQYVNTNVADIVAAAGLSHGTFYHYFRSKEEVFREVARNLQQGMLDARETMEVGPDASVLERIEATNRGYLAAYRDQARLIAAIEQVATFNDDFRRIRREIRTGFVERSERAIADLQRRGEVPDDIPPLYAANALGSMVERFAYVWFILGEDFEFDEAVRSLTLLWARAIGLDVPAGALTTPERARRGASRGE